MNEPHRQLEEAGLTGYLSWIEETGESLEAWSVTALIPELRKDKRFMEGWGFWLHRNIGKHLTDFRGLRNQFGKGSLQIVVDKKTGRLYADVDRFSATDVVGMIGHSGEVISHWWKRLVS